MRQLALWKHIVAYVTLGLLCGWYQFIILVTPILGFFAWRGSYFCGSVLAIGVTLTFSPLSHKPWFPFTRLFIWKIWREYFEFDYEASVKLETGKKYIFFEFPHGIFPMGQFLSSSIVEDAFPDRMICGTAANVVFMFPIMRQIMAWIGTHTASRKSIKSIFSKKYDAAIIPGGIAEMYSVNDTTEGI